MNPPQLLKSVFAIWFRRLGSLRSWRAWWLKLPFFCWHSLRSNFFPVLGLLLFLGAMFWAKAQDPFTRHWFTLKTLDHQSFACVTVLPKPIRRCPVVIYAHGSGGTLMTDGNDLRQMAELGLGTASLDYDQTNEANFDAEFTTLLRYVARQPWADTNAIAWVGFSMGANRMLHLAVKGAMERREARATLTRDQHVRPDAEADRANDRLEARPTLPPQLLVLISGEGLGNATDAGGGNEEGRRQNEEMRGANDSVRTIPRARDARVRPTAPGAGELPRALPVLLIHGGQDEIFPVGDTQRLADDWHTHGQPVALQILPGLSHNLDPERGVVFRAIGEYCLTHLGGPDAWQHYHSIAQWQAEAPALIWFWLPALAWIGLRLTKVGQAVENEELKERNGTEDRIPPARDAGARQTAPEAGALPGSRFFILPSSFLLRLLAFVLATCALTETALHLVPPHYPVSPGTLALARKYSVQPKERADFEWLAAQPIWSGVKLQTLLDHVELAVYNRELINWTLDAPHYRDYVLNPVIVGQASSRSDERPFILHPSSFIISPLAWRRPLWEEFYPRIRHENSVADAVPIVGRHLRERITIAGLPGLPHEVPAIWRRQITDETGFATIYVAALRSVGVPARLAGADQVEYWDGTRWQPAPSPAVTTW